jgi:disulfide bond formation protein DsbB
MAVEPRSSDAGEIRWTWVALLVALCGSVGSVYLSVGMGLKACPLCFYQRALMMSVLAVLVVGMAKERSQAALLALLCIPLAVAGLAVAAFHEYLELAGKLECPSGLFGLGTAPQQSLVVFLVLTTVLAIAARRQPAAVAGGAMLGAVLAWACIASAPAMPAAPTKPYDQPLEICRPPYTGAQAS